MRVTVVAYVVTLLALCACDGVWLTAMMPIYQSALGTLLAPTPAFAPAMLFYLLYAAGVVILVVLPGMAAHRWTLVTARGALLGLVAYGTYDLTNQATLHDWPWRLTVLDMTWGTVLTAVAATLAYVIAALLAQRGPYPV